jgi:hypothetical protein
MHSKYVLMLFLIVITFEQAFCADLEQVVSGAEVENSLETMKTEGSSPYLGQENISDQNEMSKVNASVDSNYLFNENIKPVSVKDDPRKKYEDVGYTLPGSYDKSENYLENDKLEMVKDLRKQSSSSMNIAFIKDGFSYQSTNNIINKTIGDGYKHVKGGTIHLRSDQYFIRTALLNTFWCVGAGVGFNTGRGLFINGERSTTTFKLWEAPLDLGIGLEVPVTSLFKISGAAGPSIMGLMQNRNDIGTGEKGRNKIQASYGQFANAQFKFNLSALSTETAYELFTSSKITNLFFNLEARYHSYKNFLDPVVISGTSFGIGFTFEYL